MKKWFKKHYVFIIFLSMMILDSILNDFLNSYFNLNSNHMLKLVIYLLKLVTGLVLMFTLLNKVEKYLQDK
jgi:hypothetical protein